MNPVVSIVIGSYNRRRFLRRAIASIRESGTTVPHEIIVVDGGSSDGALKYLAAQKDITTIVQHNHGTWQGRSLERQSWGTFMNLGFRAARGRYICMLSDDALVVPGSIQSGYEMFEKLCGEGRKIGAVAFYWRNWPEQQEYQVGCSFGDWMYVNHGIYLKSAVEDVGYIDEGFAFYHADGDLCLKMWNKGYECVDCPDAFVEHYAHANVGHRSSNRARQQRDWERYLKKWTGIYYEADGPTGKVVRRAYTDPHDTWKGFRRFHVESRCRAAVRWRWRAIVQGVQNGCRSEIRSER